MIKASSISLSFSSTRVLSEIELELNPAEIVGLIGPPNAGKSLLIKTLAGLQSPSSGILSWSGSPIVDWEEHRQRVGMAFQNDALFDALSVFENVAFPLRRRRVAEEDIQQRVEYSLEQVGLLAAAAKKPSEISGGMRKRVGIARATVIRPQLALFDDPTAGLDPLTGSQIMELIVRLRTQLETTALICSNELEVLFPVCERILMLHQGRVVFWGPTKEIDQCLEPVVYQFIRGADEGPL